MKVCSGCQRCYPDTVELCHDELSYIGDGSPEMVPGYRLHSLLNSAVSGETYRARRSSSGESCLIRILPKFENVEQFVRETDLAAKFFHPNIVDVYEGGVLESGVTYAVTEDPDGRTLRQLLDDVGAPELLTSIEMVRQAAEGLHALHLSGLTHRAVNPDNIILTTDADRGLLVRLQNLDLGGIAERSIISDKSSIDGHVGSLKYFSPEQCSAGGGSPATDIYSLGIVFYEMLAGAPPFDASKAVGLIEMHRHQTPPDVKIDNFDLRMLVTYALTESLQKQPRLRQSSANALARQLRHIEQLATHSSTPPPAGAVGAKPTRRRESSPATVIIAPSKEISEPTLVRREEPRVEMPVSVERAEPVPVIAKVDVIPVELSPVIMELEPPMKVAAAPAVAEIVAAEMSEIANDSSLTPVTLETPEKTTEPVAVKVVEPIFVPGPPKRSRMRSLKKKLHEMSAAVLESRVAEAVAKAVEKTTSSELVQIPFEPGQKAPPKKIAWAQPADDIPTEADVVEILADEKIAEIPVVETKPEVTSAPETVLPPAAVVLPPQMKPAVPAEITVVQPRLPSKPTARKAVAAKVQAAKPAMPQKAVVVQSTPARVPVQSLPIVVSPGPDEITLVRAPRSRVRIDIDRPPSQAPPNRRKTEELEFFPTIIGRRQVATVQTVDVPGAVFSAYYDSTYDRSSIPYRSLTIGCGLIALMTLFLFGSRSFFESGDSVTAQATSKTETEPPPTQSGKALTPSKTTREVRATKAAVVKETRDVAEAKSRGRDAVKAKKAEQRSAPERAVKTEPEKRRVERSAPATAKPQPGTRPRVVREPNP